MTGAGAASADAAGTVMIFEAADLTMKALDAEASMVVAGSTVHSTEAKAAVAVDSMAAADFTAEVDSTVAVGATADIAN